MKRIHVKPKPLPRIVRIVLCVLAAAVLLFAVYAVSGYPACSPEQALRRAERRALISMRGEVLASFVFTWPASSVPVGHFRQTASRRFRLKCAVHIPCRYTKSMSP